MNCLYYGDNLDVLRRYLLDVPHSAKRDRVSRIIDPIEAAVVRYIFEQSRAGHGDKAIAKLLNERGEPSPSGKKWDSNGVWHILNRSDYNGVVTTDRTSRVFRQKPDPIFGSGLFEVKKKGEPKTQADESLRIVDTTLWAAVHERRAATERARLRDADGKLLGRPENASRYLLAGFLQCSECGGSLTHKKTPNGHHHYVCSRRNEGGAVACANGRYLPLDATDNALLDTLADVVLAPEGIERALDLAVADIDAAPAGLDEQRAAIEANVKRLDAELANLLAALKRGVPVDDDYKATKREREADLARLEHLDGLSKVPTVDRAALRDDLRGLLDDWRGLLRSEVVLSRQILRKVIDGRVTVRPDGTFTGTATYGTVLVHSCPVPPSEPPPEQVARAKPALESGTPNRPRLASGCSRFRHTPPLDVPEGGQRLNIVR